MEEVVVIVALVFVVSGWNASLSCIVAARHVSRRTFTKISSSKGSDISTGCLGSTSTSSCRNSSKTPYYQFKG
jgi:hypothetical protein